MNKSDLKTGMLVQTRNGKWFFVIKDMVNEAGKDILVYLSYTMREYMNLNRYCENLIHPSEDYSIDKVANCKFSIDFFMKQPTNEKHVESLEGFKIIWDRNKKSKEKELENLILQLSQQLKEAEDKLDEIKSH